MKKGILIKVSEEVRQELTKLAHQNNMNRAEFIRLALMELLAPKAK